MTVSNTQRASRFLTRFASVAAMLAIVIAGQSALGQTPEAVPKGAARRP